MRTTGSLVGAAALTLVAWGAPGGAEEPGPAGKSWIAEASLLVELDYHPSAGNFAVYGEGMEGEPLRRYLGQVQPDCLIAHALGCLGWPAYDSQVAPAHPDLRLGFLEQVRAACDEAGVRMGLYVASFDLAPGGRELSPEQVERWCVRNAAGERLAGKFCPSSPWAEEFLIPLCREAQERFRPAMLWFDGTRLPEPCYCDWCAAAWREAYGTEPAPPQDANQRAALHRFSDRTLVECMERIAEALHATDPELVLCWANGLDFHTLRAPWPGADCVGGDEANNADPVVARFYAGYTAALGLPWHLWIPDVVLTEGFPLRSVETLRGESATMLAAGGGICLWHVVQADGSLRPGAEELAQQAAELLRSRAGWTLGNPSAANTAVLASQAQNLRYPSRYQPLERGLQAAHELLAQARIPCEVVSDELLIPRLGQYDLVILPETQLLAPATAAALEEWVEQGGRLLVVGPAPVVAEAERVEADSPRLLGLEATWGEETAWWGEGEQATAVGLPLWPRVAMETIWPPAEERGGPGLLARVSREEGEVWWLTATLLSAGGGAVYDVLAPGLGAAPGPGADQPPGEPTGALAALLGAAVEQALGKRRLVQVEGGEGLWVTVNRRGADLYVHLARHPAAESGEVEGRQVTLQVRTAAEAQRVERLPDGELHGERVRGGYRVTLPAPGEHVVIRLVGAARE